MTEQYNEQISLLCNMQGAELLMALQGHSDALQAIYRVHEAPLSKNSKRLRQTLDALIETQQLDNHWRWQENSSLAQYVRNLPDDKANFSKHWQLNRPNQHPTTKHYERRLSAQPIEPDRPSVNSTNVSNSPSSKVFSVRISTKRTR